MLNNSADDQSMLVATACCLHRAATYERSPTFTRWFTMALLSYLVTETVYHSIADEQMVHELSFFVGCLVVAYYTRRLIRKRVAKREDRQKLTRLIWLAVCE